MLPPKAPPAALATAVTATTAIAAVPPDAIIPAVTRPAAKPAPTAPPDTAPVRYPLAVPAMHLPIRCHQEASNPSGKRSRLCWLLRNLQLSPINPLNFNIRFVL